MILDDNTSLYIIICPSLFSGLLWAYLVYLVEHLEQLSCVLILGLPLINPSLEKDLFDFFLITNREIITINDNDPIIIKTL
jgi:hypothetical protein